MTRIEAIDEAVRRTLQNSPFYREFLTGIQRIELRAVLRQGPPPFPDYPRDDNRLIA